MGKEQELRRCPFCGKPAYVSEPDSPSLGYEIGCPDNWNFKRGAHGHCEVAPAATGMTYAETADRWNRRSSSDEAEVVAKPDYWALHTKGGVHIGLWKDGQTALKVSLEYSIQGCVITPLYASPSGVKAGVTEEALRSAVGMCEQYAEFIRRVPAADIEQHPYLPELEQVIEAGRLALRKEAPDAHR